ncbi:MAG TPA: ABC transporter substrate-binding protein [Pseudonocardiaceae bacterium]|nr:ABC transporter substrate-binding protein [Pseudonocardiaceae bacterium]
MATVFRPGPSMYPALMNGSLDIGATDYVNFFGAVTKKTLTGKVVAEPYAATTSAVVLRTPPDSAIHSPADLSGRTIAGQAPGNICELLARALSRRNNPDPNSPKFVPIHFPDMPGARRAGQVDAAVEPEPSITEAERGVAVREPVSPITLAPTGMPLSGYVASDRFISADPEAVAAAQRSSELIDTVRHTLLPWAPKGGAV